MSWGVEIPYLWVGDINALCLQHTVVLSGIYIYNYYNGESLLMSSYLVRFKESHDFKIFTNRYHQSATYKNELSKFMDGLLPYDHFEASYQDAVLSSPEYIAYVDRLIFKKEVKKEYAFKGKMRSPKKILQEEARNSVSSHKPNKPHKYRKNCHFDKAAKIINKAEAASFVQDFTLIKRQE